MTLRERLADRYGREEAEYEALEVPAKGHIDRETVAAIHALATGAHGGDIAARDCLFLSLQPRLECISNSLRPWPNTPAMIGLWDRQDVRQEAWIVFAELLAAWDESVTFVPYFFSRFAWRLRDRILRGIGKSQQGVGSIRIPEALLPELLVASDAEQPESVAIARALLEELLSMHTEGAKPSDDVESWLGLIGSSDAAALVSPRKGRLVKSASKKLRLA